MNIVCKRTPMIITPSGKKPKPKMPSKGLPTLPKGIPTIHEPPGGQHKSSHATPTNPSDSKIEQKEQHCVLLKFETLPKYSKVISISIILRISELKAVLSSNIKHCGDACSVLVWVACFRHYHQCKYHHNWPFPSPSCGKLRGKLGLLSLLKTNCL